jgi:hypothetical protein
MVSRPARAHRAHARIGRAALSTAQSIAPQKRMVRAMERIIAGRFHTKGEADGAAALIVQYADSADICIFHNNPPGQHDQFGAGGDEDEDPGTRGAGRTAAGSAVAGGIAGGAVGAVGGPVVAIAAAATGA